MPTSGWCTPHSGAPALRLSAQPDPEFQRVSATQRGRIVLQLEAILCVEAPPILRAAAIECAQYLDFRAGAVGDHLAGGAVILEACFIDTCPQYRCFGNLH